MFALFGDSLFMARVILVFISLLSVFVFYKIIRKMDGERTALLTTLLIVASRTFLDSNMSLLTEAVTNAFTIFALYFLLYKKPKSMDYWISGLLLGVSFLFKQTAVAILVAVMLYLFYKRKNREAIYVAAPFAIITVLFAAAFSYTDLFYYLFTFGTQISTMEIFTKIRVWLLFLLPVLWLGYAYLARELIHKRFSIMTATALVITLTLLPLKEIWGHSFTQVLFFIAYFTSKAMLELIKANKKIISLIVVLMLLGSLAVFLQYALPNKLACYTDENSACNTLREAQYAVKDYLEGKEGSLFSDSPIFYYLTGKKMTYHTYGIIGAPVSVFGLSDLVPTLEQNKTDYLILWKAIYTEKLTSYNIIPYIKENYELVFEKDPYMVFKRSKI
jgi:hypothetical protein